MRVLGVDPGTQTTGFGVVSSQGSRLVAETFGAVTTDPATPTADRLVAIHRQVALLIARYRPDALVVEQVFFNRNSGSAMAVGQARGVVLLAAGQAGLPVHEVTPLEVKQAVVGYGRAEKRQVQAMVRVLLGLDEPPRPPDAADALAAAICCLHARPLADRVAQAAGPRPTPGGYPPAPAGAGRARAPGAGPEEAGR